MPLVGYGGEVRAHALVDQVDYPTFVSNPYWGSELDQLELGWNIYPPHSPPYYSDESSAIEHRLCRANGLMYANRHWKWLGLQPEDQHAA